MKNKKKKIVYKEDDGRTLYSMSGLYPEQSHQDTSSKLDINRKEKKAMRRALTQVMLPRLICVLIGFTICFLILYFWLK